MPGASNTSWGMAERAFQKLADVDMDLVRRIMQRGEYDRIPRLIRREEVEAAAQGRAPVVPRELRPYKGVTGAQAHVLGQGKKDWAAGVADDVAKAMGLPGAEPFKNWEWRAPKPGGTPAATQKAPSAAVHPKAPSTVVHPATSVRRAPMANPNITIQNIMPGPSGLKPSQSRLAGMGRFAGKGALMVGAVAGIGGAMSGLSKAYDALTFKKDYERMLDFAPEIKDYDPKAVKARFQTLRRFNPEMSKDPLVASSWIKQTIEYPVVTPATLKDVAARGPGISIGDIAKLLPGMGREEPF